MKTKDWQTRNPEQYLVYTCPFCGKRMLNGLEEHGMTHTKEELVKLIVWPVDMVDTKTKQKGRRPKNETSN